MNNLIENIISINMEWEKKYNQIYDYYLSNYFSIYGLEKFNKDLYEWLLQQKKNKNLTENQKNKINKLQIDYKNYIFSKNYGKILGFIEQGHNLTQLRKMDKNLFAWYRNILIKYDELDDDKKQKISYAKSKLSYNGDNYILKQNLELLEQYLKEHGSLENLHIENPELYYYLQGKKQTIKRIDIKDANLKKEIFTFIKYYEQSILEKKEKIFEKNAYEILHLLEQGETIKSISKKVNRLIVWFYRCKKRKNLTPYQKEVLDKISNYQKGKGLLNKANERLWYMTYDKLKTYYEDHGASLVGLLKNDYSLYKWWLRNKNSTQPEKQALMKEFSSVKDANWNAMYDRVSQKLSQNARLNAKEKTWLRYQEKRKDSLTDQQKEKIDGLIL